MTILSYASLPARAATEWPERVALRFVDRAWTYREFDVAVESAATRLRAAGITPGTRTALLGENSPGYVIAQFALARVGAVFTTPNPYWTAAELDDALDAVDAGAAIRSDRHRLTARKLPIELTFDEIYCADRELPAESLPTGDRDPFPATAEAFIPFSSGTTGRPKGVIHTRGSLSGGVAQMVDHLGVTAEDRLQLSLPLCHIFGTSMMGAALAAGAEVTLFERFDLETCLRHVRDAGVTIWPLAGAVAHHLAAMPGIGADDFPALRYFMWGGSALPAELASAITAKTGKRFLCSYGMTEAMAVAFNPVDRPEDWRIDSPGFPAAGTDVRLGADDEIEVRGVSVARGYAGVDPAANDEAHTSDHWFRTGDVGRIDPDGRLWITDRLKDMIKVSGFQVAPTEVEDELLRLPGIVDAAVVGRRDDRYGEVPVAFVVAVPPGEPSPEFTIDDVRRELAERLATYKLPRELVFVDSIPRTTGGKVRRSALRTPSAPQ